MIFDKIKERMNIGKERYGHGVRVDDDTTAWGTKNNSWIEMAEEELLDCLIYTIADYIRQNNEEYKFKINGDDNFNIMYILENHKQLMKAGFHKTMVVTLINMLERYSHFY